MPVWAELEIIGASAEVAEQRLARRDSMAVVAIAHEVFTGASGVGHWKAEPCR